ncbi:MAG: class I SAM-dependent methyltransferase [Muribaculaceae bacterium]|nr:class I SAM-dependent methyltransferase [Roseburia sp.]MCM1430778.1 class I SAM-dependent methyltransferase [Muribaculaceae bacterium]MCM1492757.1 class I SAM-dependent methyltransferase [Muribaculaceae bacterium]
MDCAAGTGIYAFYLADKGHVVTATDMSVFEDNSFDVVLNMGPFYHLITESEREKCLSECIRVLRKGGLLRHDDENCFWTDTYYSSKEEMEVLYHSHQLRVTDHFVQDGLAPLLHEKVDSWSEEKFKIWCDYHYSVCRESSVLGSSNHAVIIGTK